MSSSVIIDPIGRDIEVMLDQTLSPQAQAALFAEFAVEQIEDVKQFDSQALGRVPNVTVAVDGRAGAPLESVKPGGEIVAEFDVGNVDALTWIYQQLRAHSPVSHGYDPDPNIEYLDSHKLFADDQEISPDGPILPARQWIFVSALSYSRKIERGESSQAPDGVYQAVAILAQPMFPDMDIKFEYHTGNGYVRMPAIIITPRVV